MDIGIAIRYSVVKWKQPLSCNNFRGTSVPAAGNEVTLSNF